MSERLEWNKRRLQEIAAKQRLFFRIRMRPTPQTLHYRYLIGLQRKYDKRLN